MKFYECKTCGNVMVLFEDSGVTPMCCGSPMVELVPQSKDGSTEKHVPKIDIKDGKIIVSVGEILHPMQDDHYIKWVVLETDKGKYIKTLKPGEDPIASFTIENDEKPFVAYEFCSIHSLWEKKV